MTEKVEQCGCVTDPYQKSIKPCTILKEHLEPSLDKINRGTNTTVKFVGL